MREVRAINMTAVRGRELCYVSEKEVFRFFRNLGPFWARRRQCVATNLGLPGPSPITRRDRIPREGIIGVSIGMLTCGKTPCQKEIKKERK